MKVNNIAQEKEKIVCSVELEDSEWKDLIEKEKVKAAKNVKIPGFRKGKVPEKEAFKHLNMQQIIFKTLDKAVYISIKELENNEELKKINKEVYPTPTVDFKKEINENSLSFDVVYWLMPKVTVDNYKDLKADIKKIEVKDEEVEKEIKKLLDSEKLYFKKESGVIEKGDQANFDFTGFIDDKEFAGGKAKDYDLEIGSGLFIPGFEDQMIGMKVGEEKDVKVTFPEDYHAKDKAGKEAIFKVKINAVNTIKLPELNEEFIANLKLADSSIKTPEEFKKFLKNNMQKYFEQQSYESNIAKINKAIFEHSKYDEIPEIMIDDEKKEIRKELDNRIAQMGIKFDDFLKFTNKTKESIDQEINEQAKQNCVVYGALDYIIDKEKIDVSQKELDERLEMIASSYKKTVEEIKKTIDVNVLKDSILHEKALLDLIKWNSK